MGKERKCWGLGRLGNKKDEGVWKRLDVWVSEMYEFICYEKRREYTCDMIIFSSCLSYLRKAFPFLLFPCLLVIYFLGAKPK